MPALNKVMLIGYLGADPELRHTEDNVAVANLRLATTTRWQDRNNGDWKERTEWHRIVLWGKLAERASEQLSKGKPIYVEGALQTREWEDKDGKKRFTTEVRAQRLQRLFKLTEQAPEATAPADETPPQTTTDPATHDEDIPI